MTEPLAAAPAAQKSVAAKWIIGCGLGCFVLILIAVAAVVVHHSIRYANAKQLSRQILRSAFAAGGTHVVSQPSHRQGSRL